MPSDSRQGPAIAETVREVQAIFPSDAALQDAIGRLTRSGLDRAALSLPAASPHPSQATPSAGAENPNTEDDSRQARTLGASMAAAAAALAGAGAVVMTGGVAAAAVAAAAGAGALAGGAVEGAHRMADRAQSDGRDQAAAAGTLVLSARVSDAASESRISEAMLAAGACRVEVVTRRGGQLVGSAAG